MAEEPCNFLSQMCGYFNKIFTGEHDLDNLIEKFNFLEELKEIDEEDKVVSSADVGSDLLEQININVKKNKKTVREAAEKYEIHDRDVMRTDSVELDNVKVKNENCPQTNNYGM